MKIVLIGYGAMGKLIHRLAKESQHEIVGIIDDSDSGLSSSQLAEKLSGAEAAIDFTASAAVVRNVEAAMAAGVPLVEGTTGWSENRDDVVQMVVRANGAMVFGANFSIGVNLFYKVADHAARLFAEFPEYEAFIEEQHHSRKKDSPSGTALKIKEIVSKSVHTGDISATRAGSIPGTHRLGFDGPADQILIEHRARSREGFAMGAIRATEWIVGRHGFYEFTEVVDEILKGEKSAPPV